MGGARGAGSEDAPGGLKGVHELAAGHGSRKRVSAHRDGLVHVPHLHLAVSNCPKHKHRRAILWQGRNVLIDLDQLASPRRANSVGT
jgi:hypothetical protein